ncbi:MAG: peptidylprolyl isomerase [Deltaproteobacteria bacterium]|nr:MAG: peptidylprolyl isomerase [Deltaproteobacteria bacterium]
MPKHLKLAVLFMSLIFSFPLLFCTQGYPAQDKVVRDYVATVNGKKISKQKYERELSSLRNRFRASGRQLTPLQEVELKKNLLESLINRELLYQESVKRGIKVDEKAVERQLAEVKKRYPTEAAFKEALKRAHYSEADIKYQLKRAIAIEQFINEELRSHIHITDKNAREFYDSHPDLFRRPEQVRASHILIKVGLNPTKEEKQKAMKKIKEIQEKLKKGKDFAELAQAFSDAPSASRGGDLGYFSRGQMVKSFEEAAFALNIGQVSDPVETPFGYHLIKVTDKRPETKMAFAEIKDRLKPYLVDQELREKVRVYAENLKKKAKIERFLPDMP